MPTGTTPQIDQFKITVAGSPLPQADLNNVFHIEVDLTTTMPAMATLEFHVQDTALIDGTKFDVGAEIGISFKSRDEQAFVEIFKGEVVIVQPEFDEQMQINFKIVAFDKLHRLNRGKKTRTFLQVTDSDIITQIAGEVGLTVEVTATTPQYDHTFQENVSDLEFFQTLARRNGMYLTCEAHKLVLKPQSAVQAAASVATIAFGADMLYFRPRISTAHQVSEVQINGWDYKQKSVATGTAASSTTHPQLGLGKSGKQLIASFGATKHFEYQPDATTQAAADKFAQARLDDINGQVVPTEARCVGNSKIIPKAKVQIQNVGTKFSGTYIVTRARHLYNYQNGYEVEFFAEGVTPSTISSLASADDGPYRVWAGVVPAIVTNINDPDGLGRVKVKFPWLSDQKESTWARMVSADAGPTRGMYFLPEVNDEVVVAFENGSFNHPYVLGGVWNGRDKPPEAIGTVVASGATVKRMWKTRTGHILAFNEASGTSSIEILEKNGLKVVLDGTNKKIEVSDGGSNKVVIDITGRKITIASEGDISLEGMNVNIKATAGVKIEASGMTEIKGATVKIN